MNTCILCQRDINGKNIKEGTNEVNNAHEELGLDKIDNEIHICEECGHVRIVDVKIENRYGEAIRKFSDLINNMAFDLDKTDSEAIKV